MNQGVDVAELRRDLAAHAGIIAMGLIGEPNRALSTRHDWRWGSHGSLSIVIAGERAGLWHDHESGDGGDLLALIRRERACSFPEAVQIAGELVGGRRFDPPPPIRSSAANGVRTKNDHVDLAVELWRGTKRASGTLVERYLAGRGLRLPSAVIDLRYHPECPRGADRLPAMVAAMRDIRFNSIVGVHRTFLSCEAIKAPGVSKMMLGRSSGAAIKVSPDERVAAGLFIAEGVETALALIGFGFEPAWALGSAAAIGEFPLLPGVDCLTIAVDHDANGTGARAAERCAERWRGAGVEVRMMRSPAIGEDIADLANRCAS